MLCAPSFPCPFTHRSNTLAEWQLQPEGRQEEASCCSLRRQWWQQLWPPKMSTKKSEGVLVACGFFFRFPMGGVKPHFDHCALGIFLKNLNGTVAASNVGLGWLRIQFSTQCLLYFGHEYSKLTLFVWGKCN